jgi:hypothetical protein
MKIDKVLQFFVYIVPCNHPIVEFSWDLRRNYQGIKLVLVKLYLQQSNSHTTYHHSSLPPTSSHIIHHLEEWGQSTSFKKKNDYYKDLNLNSSAFLKAYSAISIPPYLVNLAGQAKIG